MFSQVSVNSSGKKRLILDLSELNVFIKKKKIKFEDWRVALNYFTKGCFLFKFDLKSKTDFSLLTRKPASNKDLSTNFE
jgi:hypothetical protein